MRVPLSACWGNLFGNSPCLGMLGMGLLDEALLTALSLL
jgi:hypothetical protein